MNYQDTEEAQEYMRLKVLADQAYEDYLNKPCHTTWTLSNQTEEAVAIYAYENEEAIFN